MDEAHADTGDQRKVVLSQLLGSAPGSNHLSERLHQLIANHARYTSSARARHILENWDAYLPKFRKVMPVEYRRALKEMKANADAEPKIAIGA